MKKDGRNQAAGDRADEERHEKRHGIRRSHRIGHRQEEGNCHGGRKTGQCAKYNTDCDTDQHQEDARRCQNGAKTNADKLPN